MKLFESFKSDDKYLTEFALLIGKLDGQEFIGLCKMLMVPVFDPEKKDEKGHPAPREAEAIIEDCLIAFDKANRKYRKDLLKLLRKVVK